MTKRPMALTLHTPEEYAILKGQACPFCGSEDDIEGSDWEALGGGGGQAVACLNCDGEWLDNYKLIGFTVLAAPSRDALDRAIALVQSRKASTGEE